MIHAQTPKSRLNHLTNLFLSGLIFTATFMSGVAQAEDLIWNSVRARGGGDGTPCRFDPETPGRNNVIWSAAGGDLSIILTDWGVSLPKLARWGGGKLTTSSTCSFVASVTIPRGYYLKTLSQTLVVGVMKDRLVTGGISSNGYLFQTLVPLNQINMIFRPEEALNNALLHETNTQIFVEPYISSICQLSRLSAYTTQFKFQLVGGAARPFPQLGLQANVDGSDVQFGMDSSLERCSD